jgi:hypothetical protein
MHDVPYHSLGEEYGTLAVRHLSREERAHAPCL